MAKVDADLKPWIDGLTIGEVVRRIAFRYPDKEALVFPRKGYRITYQQLDKLTDNVAKALLGLGFRKGDHIACWATNVPEWPLLQLGSAKMGAVFVTVNPAYRSQELGYVLEQGDIQALFLIERFKQSNYYEIFHDTCDGVPSPQFSKLKHVVAMEVVAPDGFMDWNAFLAHGETVSDAELDAAMAELSANEAINIQYTSGTTGFPKAAMLTHRNILMNGYYVSGCQDITDSDRMCIPVPYYHCFGMVMGTLGALTRGATMVIPSDYFCPEATLDAIEQERATTIYGVPTMFVAMLTHPSFRGRNFSSLRSGIMAGSPCPIETMKQVITDMNVAEITIAYGQTESSPVITQTRVDDPLELRVQTVGRALPGVEVKVIDPETGDELEAGKVGELCSRGHGTMLGYYKNDTATNAVITEAGWLRTGDLAVMREGGYFSITGRIKDMVIRGGENIYPREIEEFLFTHEDIAQAAVVGVPDVKFGEELCVWVQTKSGKELSIEEIRAFCKGRLAHYKVPRYVRTVTEFPQTISGKIQKFKIRDAMMEELGLTEHKTA